MESLLASITAENFLKYRTEWQQTEKAIKDTTKGTKQAADDLVKHMKLKVAEDKRSKKRQADQKAKDELQRVKSEAKQAAEAIKKRKMAQTDVVPGIFTADLPEANCAVVPTTADPTAGTDWACPWQCRGGAALDNVMGDAALMKALTSWGAQYKKSLKGEMTIATFPMAELGYCLCSHKAQASVGPDFDSDFQA